MAERPTALYVISVAAEIVGVHPQTLRHYERLGVIAPARSPGGIRRFSERDLERVRRLLALRARGLAELARYALELEDELAARRAADAPVSPRRP